MPKVTSFTQQQTTALKSKGYTAGMIEALAKAAADDIETHSSDAVKHITAEEREAWNQGGGGKRICRFIIGTTASGWTEKDCDYLCDGEADDVEINAAIQALPSTGGEIVILDGTYNITARVMVDKDCVTLTGNGRSTILKRMFNNSRSTEGLIHMISSYNTIQNITVDGNKDVYTKIYNSSIYLSSSNSNTIVGNTCNNTGYGIRLNDSNNNNTITGNTCNNNNNCGIQVDNSNSNTISANICDGSDYGISLGSSSGNNIVVGNVCTNSNYAINLTNAKNNTIASNACTNSNRGIHAGSFSNNAITGNTCSNNTEGVLLLNSGNNTIVGNTCIRGTGLTSDYTNSQYTIRLSGTQNNYNLIACNNIMGKDVVCNGGTGNVIKDNLFKAPPTLISIAVTSMPSKMSYSADSTSDDLDLTGMVVTATYSNNKTAIVTKDVVCELDVGEGVMYVSYTENGVTCQYKLRGITLAFP